MDCVIKTKLYCYMMLSYRRETLLQGALVLAKMEDWNRETIFTDIIGLSSSSVT